MAVFAEDPDRQVIPRWRTAVESLGTREFSSLGEATSAQPIEDKFSVKQEEWIENRTVSFAAQLVGAAFVSDRLGEVQEPAEFLLEHRSIIPESLEQLATRARQERRVSNAAPSKSANAAETIIRGARRRLAVYAENPLAWVDLARGLAQVDKMRDAERAMRTGLALGPESRFVLRSATRFFIHNRSPDVAHDLLIRAESTPFDPWLVASEIAAATAAGKRPTLVKTGRRMIESKDLSEWHLNELVASLATTEFLNGSNLKARRLFRRSLTEPSENTVAQARWAAGQGVGLTIPEDALILPKAFEARAWTSYGDENWSQALTNSQQWLADQPFSARPAALGSFVASVALEDHEASVTILEEAFHANPNDATLLNNYAYALAHLGRLDDARRAIERVKYDPSDDLASVLKSATSGLIEFRLGRGAIGRKLYRAAIEMAESARNKPLAASVLTFWALEESRSLDAEATSVTYRALESPSRGSPVDTLLKNRIMARRQLGGPSSPSAAE